MGVTFNGNSNRSGSVLHTPGSGTACAKRSETLAFASADASVTAGAVPIGVYVELSGATAGTLTCRGRGADWLVNDDEDIALSIPVTGVYPFSVGTVRMTGTSDIATIIALY